MTNILVSGLINIETTLRVEGFPIPYTPVNFPFWGVRTTVSGVGYNLAKALTSLGNSVRLLALTGQDLLGEQVRAALAQDQIDPARVLAITRETAQSVILYDPHGRREIFVDLKDMQEQVYPLEVFEQAARESHLCVLANINYSRPFLQRARQMGKWVASDVHTITDLDDDYNREFMQAAQILFMSDERLPCSPEEWAGRVQQRYAPEVLVIGLGARGALLALPGGVLARVPARAPRPIVNTIGAGDALFAAFLHGYARTHDPYESLHKAVVFAGYKIGARGAAEGFLDEAGLEDFYRSDSATPPPEN